MAVKVIRLKESLILCSLILFPLVCGGQQQTLDQIGLPVKGVFSSETFDSINMLTGNLHVEIPLLSRPERGGVKNSLSLVYDSKDWEGDVVCGAEYCITDTVPGPAMQWILSTPGFSLNLSWGGCNIEPLDTPMYFWQQYDIEVIDGSNTRHHMIPDTSPTYNVRQSGNTGETQCTRRFDATTVYAEDGSGISFDTGAGVITHSDLSVTYTADNRAHDLGPDDIHGSTGTNDTNGNSGLAGGTLINSVASSQFNLYSSSFPNNGLDERDITYYDSSGTPQVIKLIYTTQQVSHAPLSDPFYYDPGWDPDGSLGTWIVPPGYSGSIHLLQSILLPNGQSYHFGYDPTFGDLTSASLPTGGSISWAYTTTDPTDFEGPGRAIVQRQVISDPGASPQTWNYGGMSAYSGVWFVGGGGTVTNPLGQTTVTTFDQYHNEIGITTMDGAGAILDQTSSSIGFPSMCGTNGAQCGFDLSRQRILTTDHILPDTNQVSRTKFDYDGVPLCSVDNACFNIPLAQRTSLKSYGYGSGVPGALLRDEETTYFHVPNTGMFDRTLTHSITGPGNSFQEKWEYDNYGAGMTATSGVPAHDYTLFSPTNAARGNVTRHSVWDNANQVWRSTTSTYDDLGNVLTVTDPKGNVTQLQYDDRPDSVAGCTPPANTRAYMTKTIDAVGHESDKTFNYCTGLLVAQRDPNQIAASGPGLRSHYDFMKRLTMQIDPLGGSVEWDFHGYANPLTVTTTKKATPDPDIVATTIHDGLGRVVQTIANPNGPGTKSIVDTTYDQIGRTHSVSNPYSASPGGGDVFSYDALNRKTNVLHADGTNQIWTYPGNVTTFTDEAGDQWQRTADALGRVVAVTEPNGATTTYSYDALSNLLGVSQPGLTGETSRNRSFIYDSLSRLTAACNPESIGNGLYCDGTNNWSDIYSYLSSGHACAGDFSLPCSKTDARGVILSYAYDALNRLTMKHSSDGTVADDLTYDRTVQGPNEIGRLSLAEHNAVAATGFYYDAVGQMNATSYYAPNSNGWQGAMNLVYDLAGNPTQINYPDGRSITQAFDGAGRLAKVSSDGKDYISGPVNGGIGYTAAGAVESFSLGNGVSMINRYNNRLQPCLSAALSPVFPAPVSPAVGNLFERAAFYQPGSNSNCGNETNNNGNIWAIIDNRILGWSQGFGYDSLNRLTSAQRRDGGYSHTYHYDSFGNLTVEDNLVSSSSVILHADAQNRLLRSHDGGITWGDNVYDAAGNLTSVSDGINPTRTHQYDALNQLVSVDSGSTASYAYNGMDERVFKQTATGWTDYTYLSGQPMAEHSSDNTWTDYIYANGQKIAKVVSAAPAWHLSGSGNGNPYCGTATWVGNVAPQLSGMTLQDGDTFAIDMKVSNARAAVAWFLNGGGSDTGGLADQHGSDGGNISDTAGQWVHRVFTIGHSYQGNTLFQLAAGVQTSPSTGPFDIWMKNAVVVRADGTIFPVYISNPVSMSFWGGGVLAVATPTDTCNVAGLKLDFNQIAADGDSGTNYYLDDHLGTAQMELSSGGWPLWQGQFTPFGQELPDGSTAMHYKFTGKERDNESGLDNFGARYFGSSMGRFMSPDDFTKDTHVPDPQSWNLYAYARNNPLRYTDPTGQNATQTTSCSTTNNQTTCNVSITATISIYATAGSGLTQSQLSAAAGAMQSSINNAWSGSFVQDGVNYNVSTNVSVSVAGSQDAAMNSGAQNVIGMTNGPINLPDGRVGAYVSPKSLMGALRGAPDTGQMDINNVDNYAKHEFTHMLGTGDNPGAVLSNTDPAMRPGRVTTQDLKWGVQESIQGVNGHYSGGIHTPVFDVPPSPNYSGRTNVGAPGAPWQWWK